MGLFKLFVLCTAVIVAGALDSAQSVVIIHFHEAPSAVSRFSTAVFKYSVEGSDGRNACSSNGCFIACELDDQALRSCPADSIVLRNLTVNQKHTFLLNVTTQNGDRNSSSYSWFIDTIPPTATLSSEDSYTNAAKVTVDVTFSEACGLKCLNSSHCDVLIDGPGSIDASSLRAVKPNLKYEVDIALSMGSMYGRVVIRMVNGSCRDKAGNPFTRSKNSAMIVRFDRRPVVADLWMPVSSYVLKINGVPRTVLSTNKMEELKIFLDFSNPIKNSTEEVLSALHVKSGSVSSVLSGHQGNGKFAFRLMNVSRTEIIVIELETSLIIGRTGTPTSPVSPLTILYDTEDPAVGLSSDLQNVTKASRINFVAEFTKPVFGFDPSMVEVHGGKIARQVQMKFKELSRALYSLTVIVEAEKTLSVSVLAGKVSDISGNQNLASNRVQLKHYSTPAVSTALQSFITAGVLATSLAVACLSLSYANIGIISALLTGETKFVAPSPSTNLHGMFGHLQVFVMSDWFSPNHPIEYSETVKGLKWLIPRGKLPWRKISTITWTNHFHITSGIKGFMAVGLPMLPVGEHKHQGNFTSYDGFRGKAVSSRSAQYGQPLNSAEYFTYFLRGEPLSASNVVKKLENNKGWEDMEMNLFWLAAIAGSLLALHISIFLLLRWRTGSTTSVNFGMVSFPRFEILLLIVMLPCISQSAAFVVKGGTIGGMITGALLLVIPAAFILSVLLFLLVAILPGKFVQYKEIKYTIVREAWYEKLWFFIISRPVMGKWVYREGSTSSLLQNFRSLFENQKGPPFFIFVDKTDQSTVPKWSEGGQSGGIGRMRAISSNDSNEEELKVPGPVRFLGYARSSYLVLDLIRRVSLGVISGAATTSKDHWMHNLIALAITMTQFVYLSSLKPFIKRSAHAVESISLLCEAAIFSISMAVTTKKPDPTEATVLGYVMVALLLLTAIAHITNEWYGLVSWLVRLSWTPRFMARGLILPFLPRKQWSSIVLPSSSQPKTGLSSVPQLSPDTDVPPPRGNSFRAMSATVVPMASPDNAGGRGETEAMVEERSELRKLRELAKASFSGEGGKRRSRDRARDSACKAEAEGDASSSSMR
ncbi:unnamed protein product [Linum tenue]|uniref:Bacterial Ig-like domain-containing protein n=1 Tax=Linum tenue TaxID=586396 RepID=A0AAV0NGT9_9ROSI|nr:unnamed protein product [Linum tenue]